MYDQVNTSFYEDVVKSTNSNMLFKSSYSPVFILEGTKSQLENVLKSDKVETAIIHKELELATYSTTSSSNTGMNYMRDTSSICGDGEGVVIGILDAGFPNVNETANGYNLFDSSKVSYAHSGTTIGDHATHVAALMVGQPIVYNGVTYCGAAPEAELVCAYKPTATPSANQALQTREAIESLISSGVNIINASIGDQCILDYIAEGTVEHQTYLQCKEMQRWVDHIAFNHDIHFVAAAGNMLDWERDKKQQDVNADGMCDNSEYVNVLGLGYNVITVGNVDDNNTLMSGYAPASLSEQDYTPYTICNESSFRMGRELLLKPDIACFGNIQYAHKNGNGTSLSAPQVAGMIAQLCSVYPRLLTNNSGVKALLAATAVYRTSDVSIIDAKAYHSEMFDRQGAGIANVRCAYNSCSAGKTRDFTLSGQTSVYSFNINVPSSYTYLRVAMSWIRKASLAGYSDDEHASNIPVDPGLANLDIHVYYNNQLIAVSENLATNLEVLQFNVTQGGTYTIKIFNRSYELDNINYGNQYVSVAWY